MNSPAQTPIATDTPPVLTDVRRLTRLARAHADRVARRHGLTMQQWELLVRLRCCAGPADQRELCGSFGITPPSLTVLIDSAEARGWIRRSEHPGDRRRRRIELTPAGADMVAHVPHLGRDVDGAMTAGFSPSERAQLSALLARAAANLREAAP